MERDPLRLVWRAAPGLNAALLAVALGLGLPALVVALDLVGLAVDVIAAGARGVEGQPVRILRYAIDLPERVRPAPLVLFAGVLVSRAVLPTVVAGGLAASVLVVGALWWGLGALGARIGRRAYDSLARRMIDGIASAPVPAAEEARLAAALTGEAVGRERRSFGLLAATPVLVGATVAATLASIGLRDFESALVLLIGLCAASLTADRRTGVETRLASAERTASSALQSALSDLARNLSAVQRHGTQATERGRISDEIRVPEREVDALRSRSVRGGALTALLMLAGPVGVLSASLWAARSQGLTPGTAAAATAAAAVAVAALAIHLRWRETLGRMRPVLSELTRVLGTFQARRRARTGGSDLPAAGPLAAEDVATGPVAVGRLAGLSLTIDLPSHVVLAGARDSGARTFAALLGGQIARTRGRVTFGGQDIADADPAERTRRLGFAGRDTYLFPGSLRLNLLYGSAGLSEGDEDERLARAVTASGLDRLVERRGLSGTVDPGREPELALAIVSARGAIRAALARRGLSGLVEPFDPERYNSHATIGENILFGAALGDTFREDRLPSQPFMRGLLDAQDLTKPLAEIGTGIARSTLEMFSDLPEGHSLVGRFALIASGEREEFERILGRRESRQRGAAAARDGERLVGLALRYSERRHRLGFLDDAMSDRLVRVREAFRTTIPKSLEPAVEFFDPDRVCGAASVRDNLLFGRVAQERAEAERDVVDLVRSVLDEVALGREIARIGLGTRVDPIDPGMSAAEIAAVEIVRCLMRDPDTLVVEHALDHLSEADAVAALERLVAARTGRGLIVALQDDLVGLASRSVDRVIRFEGGRIVECAPARTARSLHASVIGETVGT